MPRFFFTFFLSVLILFSFERAFAQGRSENLPALSLKNALELSLKNSSRLSIGRYKILEKQSVQLETRSLFLPRISLSLSEMDTSRNLKAQGVSFPGAPDKAGPFTTFDARLAFNATLLNFNLWNRYRTAGEETKVAELELSLAESDLLYQTTLLYFNALRTEAALLADRANVALSEELLKFSEDQKEAEISTALDVTRAKVKLAQDRQHLISAVAQRDNASLALEKQIGLAQGENPILVETPVKIRDFPELKESIQTALLKREELAIQSQKEKVKETQYQAAASEKYPSINIFGDYGEIGNRVADAFPTQTTGVTLTLPLFEGNGRLSREQGILSQLHQEKIKKKESALQIELEVRQIYNELISVKKQLEVAGERLTLAQKELTLAEHRFETGVGDHIELAITQTSLTEAREGLVEAEHQHRTTILKYFYVTGQMKTFFQQIP